MSSETEPPHEIRLTGEDSEEQIVLTGYSDKIGNVELVLTSEGEIYGEAVPDTIPAVQIGGYVNPETVYLGFIVLEIFEGSANLSYEGPIIEEEENNWFSWPE